MLSEVDFGICFILNVSVKTDVSSVAREYLQNVGQEQDLATVLIAM